MSGTIFLQAVISSTIRLNVIVYVILVHPTFALNNMRKGFTLIELLVTITIIGVLAALVTANLSDARSRARDAKIKQNLIQLKTALRLYYNDNQSYPVDTAAVNALSTVYIKQIPVFRYYEQLDSGDGFVLKATLENPSDPDLAASQAGCPDGSNADADSDYAVCAD